MENQPMKPKNYLVEAILSTIFCCQISGIISIIYAAQVNSYYAEGRYEDAQRASKNAKTWFLVGLIVGIISIVMIFALGGLAFLNEVSNNM